MGYYETGGGSGPEPLRGYDDRSNERYRCETDRACRAEYQPVYVVPKKGPYFKRALKRVFKRVRTWFTP